MNNKEFIINFLDWSFLIKHQNKLIYEIDLLNENYKISFENLEHDQEFINKVKLEFIKYLSNESNNLNFDILLIGTNFQKSVWEILLSIPYGETLSYEDIANKIGNKNKVRAVGNAVGSNPLLIKVPCHRVIRKSGELGGFSTGIENKIRLLKLEGVL